MDLKREEAKQDNNVYKFKATQGQLRLTIRKRESRRPSRKHIKRPALGTLSVLTESEESEKTRDLRVEGEQEEEKQVCSMRTLPAKATTIPDLGGPSSGEPLAIKSGTSLSDLKRPKRYSGLVANCPYGYTLLEEARICPSGRLLPLLVALVVALSAGLALKLTPGAEAIKLQPEGREKFYWSGEQFIITCQNNNNIKNVKFRWLGPNNTDITEHRDVRVHTESAGPHGHRLVVLNATAGVDDGLYRCQLGSTDDRSPRETTDFNLKLFRTTSFKDTVRHLVLPVASKGVLNCHVEFDPNVFQPTVSWHRDQKPIEMFNDSTYTVLEYDPSRQLSQLTIRPLTRKHDGVYSCRADAITTHLSKISEHEIRLETNYAPSFEQSSPQTIWVERLGSGGSVSAAGRQSNVYAGGNAAGRPTMGTGSSYQKQNRFRGQPFGVSARRPPGSSMDEMQEQSGESNNGNSSQVVRVELKCTCQSNPTASILWTASDNRPFVLARGEPGHVLEDPRVQVDGHNTTSTLTIGYNLDPSWSHRQTSYICSASNQVGEASMTFKIEQGDPPPAFSVAAHKNYDPESSMFRFTLLGVDHDPESQHLQQQQQPILPPIDSFRIRAESSSGSPLGVEGNPTRLPSSEWQKSRSSRPSSHDSASVQWNLPMVGNGNGDGQQPAPIALPQTLNISLARLPSGNQRLFLEAHNAVGWSPNATYLGDYYIVSAGFSPIRQGYYSAAYLMMLGSAMLLVYGLIFGTARPAREGLTKLTGS